MIRTCSVLLVPGDPDRLVADMVNFDFEQVGGRDC